MTSGSAPSRLMGFRRLFAAISVNMSASVLTALAGLGATAFMARRLQVQEFGGIMLLLTAVNAFAIFEGLRPVIIHRVSAGAENSGALFRSAVRVNQLMVGFTLLVLVATLLAGAGSGLPTAAGPMLGLIVVAFFGTMQYWAFLDAEQDTVFTGVARSISLIVLYVSICLVAYLRLNLFYYTIPILLSQSLLFLAFYIRFETHGWAAKYRFTEDGPVAVENLLGPALNNIVFNACAVTINVADRAIVGSVLGASAAGLYAGPSELSLRAVGLVRVGMQVALPWASRLPAEKQQQYWMNSVIVILLAVGSGASLLLLQRDFFAVVLLGSEFRTTGDLLGLFGVGVLFSTLGYACMVQLNARGDFTTQRKLYSVSAAALIVGGAWGAYQGRLLYVAIAYLLARSVDLVILGLLMWRCTIVSKTWFIALAVAMAIALVAAWNRSYWETAAFLAIAYALGYASFRSGKRLGG